MFFRDRGFRLLGGSGFLFTLFLKFRNMLHKPAGSRQVKQPKVPLRVQVPNNHILS